MECGQNDDSIEVVRERRGDAVVTVCSGCAGLSLQLGKIVLRMPCSRFASFRQSLAMLRQQSNSSEGSFLLDIAGTGVSVALEYEDLQIVEELARSLAKSEVFCRCCVDTDNDIDTPHRVN